MDMVSLGIAAISIAGSAIGGVMKFQGAQEQTAAQEGMITTEQAQNTLRQQMMHLSAAREGMELMRNAQRARSLALAGSVQHGAQFGSGLQGGFGQIGGATNVQEGKIAQDTESGDQMFALQNQLSAQKFAYAQAGGLINIGAGVTDIGKVLGQGNQQLTSLTKQGAGYLTPDAFPSSGYYG